jgi:phosphoribosylglycinamide formyltransferase-1
MQKTSRLVVLISGNGSNLQAIIDACVSGELAAEIALVISNKADAFGLERARKANIPVLIKTKIAEQTREEYDAELAMEILKIKPGWIVLAGWMRILTQAFLKNFPEQVINLHPALPGMFAGTQAIERAFEAFQKNEIQHTGVMVHLVPDEGVDCGPVLAEKVVPIYQQDTLAMLRERVHATEHELLISVLKKLTAKF